MGGHKAQQLLRAPPQYCQVLKSTQHAPNNNTLSVKERVQREQHALRCEFLAKVTNH